MSNFLHAFAHRIVLELVAAERMVVAPESVESVIEQLRVRLTQPREGQSLISAVSTALLSIPEVDELFADDDELREDWDEQVFDVQFAQGGGGPRDGEVGERRHGGELLRRRDRHP